MSRIETRCVQAGYTPGNGEPRQIPIIQSTTFKYDTSEDMGKLFDLQAEGYFYSRLQNPTCDTVAARICALEGGTAAMLTGSGQAANFYAVFNIANVGDHVVACSAIYGGTYNLFAVTMKKMGIDFTFVSPDCTEEELDAAFRPNTKALFGETIANPALSVLDIELFAKVAHRHGVPLIVDNTFATPVNCRPFEWGADIVTHSTTKYMDGHGSAVGGAIVDSGKFDWDRYAEKYPGLTTPDESYHGIIYTKQFGIGKAFITKATSQLMRDFGSVQSPQSAYLLGLGLESLHVRMQRHCENAQSVAEYLAGHDKVAWLLRPEGRPVLRTGTEIPAQRILRRGFFRGEGRPEGSGSFHEKAEDRCHRDPCGGCQDLLPAPCQRHPPPDERRGAGRRRRFPGPDPAERRPGKQGGPDRGSGTGAGIKRIRTAKAARVFIA